MIQVSLLLFGVFIWVWLPPWMIDDGVLDSTTIRLNVDRQLRYL
jgi:hypothetical protein